MNKLEPIIKEIIPHEVEFDELQVKGNNPTNQTNNRKKEEATQEEEEEQVVNQLDDMINYTWVNPAIETKKSSPSIHQIDATANGFLNRLDNENDDILASYEDVVDEPIFGPCLVFGGQTAVWTGPDAQNEGIVALESRLNFETKAGKRVLATFEIFNAGTSAIYYEWKVCIN